MINPPPDKNSAGAGIGIEMFGGIFGKDRVKCDGNDAGGWTIDRCCC